MMNPLAKPNLVLMGLVFLFSLAYLALLPDDTPWRPVVSILGVVAIAIVCRAVLTRIARR
jgi:hypothetical protein